MRKQAQATVLAAEAKKKGMHYAIVVHAEAGGIGQSIALPGTLLGQIESPISSRASGYVLRWTRDIGTSVKKGELLAEISSPETEQQIKQAVAAREQAASAANLAKITLERWKGLLDQRAVSQQEYDERRSAYEQSLSNVGALEANIQRLKELLGFARILAPFDGVITRRNVNVGDLVEAGTNTSRPLFVLTQINTLRVYVYVPQAYSNNIRVGQVVSLRQAELPEQKFEAKIIRTARAIDPASRSLQVEISVQNPGGSLLPGAYVEVSLPANNRAGLVVPINTLLLRGEGPRIAVVDDKGYVRLNAVELGKDFGSKIEILSGITVTDRLVLNPGDGLSDGDHLQIIDKKDNLKDKSMKDKVKNN
jgi:RND family efflux transporter MFP subunit